MSPKERVRILDSGSHPLVTDWMIFCAFFAVEVFVDPILRPLYCNRLELFLATMAVDANGFILLALGY